MKILVTNKFEGPEGWDVIPMWDDHVFFDPNAVDEIDVIEPVEKAKNGDLEPLKAAAEFVLPNWQG